MLIKRGELMSLENQNVIDQKRILDLNKHWPLFLNESRLKEENISYVKEIPINCSSTLSDIKSNEELISKCKFY